MEPLLEDSQLDGLTTLKSWIFGTGHLLNDLAGAIWFNYALFFMSQVAGVPSSLAGSVILIGQVTDAISTLLIGYLSDRYDSAIGKRTPWYLGGSILMPLGIFFIFRRSPFEELPVLQFVWYCCFAMLFNIGWASTQIAHISLIPAITPLKEKKDFIIGIRTAFTYIANIVVLILALLMFELISSSIDQFQLLILMLLIIGGMMSLLFLVIIREKDLCRIADRGYREMNRSVGTSKEVTDWKEWMRRPQMYVIAAVYMFCRVGNNYTTGMIPFYLKNVLDITNHASIIPYKNEVVMDIEDSETSWELAVVPLVMYLSGVVASFTQPHIPLSRKVLYIIGMIFAITGLSAMAIIEEKNLIFPIAVVLGIGFSMCLNCATGIISAFIGSDAKSGAIVWGFMGLIDKTGSGLAFFFASNYGSLSDPLLIRWETCILSFILCALGIIFILFVKHIQELSSKDL